MSETYSTHEVSENNGKSGKPVWIIVKGVVYDVTKFLKDHPGGDELILEYGGKDATKAFNDAGHSVDAIQDMKSYRIGTVNNQLSQQCAAITNPLKETTIMVAGTTMPHEQNYRKEKKRLKLFFCF